MSDREHPIIDLPDDDLTPREHEVVEHPPVQSSRFRRLLAAVGWFYGICLLLAVGTLMGFGVLANEVVEQEFVRFNTRVLLAIHAYATPTLDSVALAVTELGGVIGVTVLVIVTGGVLVWKKRRLDAATLLVVVIGGAVLVGALKGAFQQIRPRVFEPLATELAFSFPSGHTLLSFCFWGFLSALLVTRNPRQLWRWIAGSLLMIVPAVVALSRLYIGVHWPTDVMAGILLATFWVSACLAGERWLIARAAGRGAEGPRD